MVNSSRQKEMIFSVREKASSGAARGPWRRAPKGRCNETERMGPARAVSSNGCAMRLRVPHAAPRGVAGQKRTNRRNGKLRLPIVQERTFC